MTRSEITAAQGGTPGATWATGIRITAAVVDRHGPAWLFDVSVFKCRTPPFTFDRALLEHNEDDFT